MAPVPGQSKKLIVYDDTSCNRIYAYNFILAEEGQEMNLMW